MRPPDTDIPCRQCNGTKVTYAGANRVKCGACFGTGLSTAQCDQRRNGTTVTVWDSENRTFPTDTTFHRPGKTVARYRLGGLVCERGSIYLISWPNPHYQGKP